MTPEALVERATAIAGENLELQREIAQLRGRLKEARYSANYYRAKYQAAMKYQFDAETDHQRDKTRRRELAIALVGAAVTVTCLLFVAACCWGYWHY